VRSHLTLQLYLDDVPARVGGNTRFYADPRGETPWASLAPATGTAIVFDHRAWHDGEPVTEGIKHVLRTDVMYRRAATTRHPSTDDRVLYRHDGYAWHVIVCRNGSLASAGRDGTVRRWGESLTATIDLGAGSVTRLVEATDGRLWCGTRAGGLFIVDGLRVSAAAREDGAILALAARPDGGVVAATALGTIVAYERNGSRAWSTRAHDGWAWSVVRAGEGYLSAGDDGTIVALDDHGQLAPLASIGASLRAIAVAGDQVWCGDASGVLHQVDRSGQLVTSHAAHRAAITGLAVRGDGSLVSGGEDGVLRVWSGEECTTELTASDFVTSVAEGTRGELVCTSYDGAVYRQWQPES
jgi:WD40 repeat protein